MGAVASLSFTRFSQWPDHSVLVVALMTIGAVATLGFWAAAGALIGCWAPPALAPLVSGLTAIILWFLAAYSLEPTHLSFLVLTDEMWVQQRPTIARALCLMMFWAAAAAGCWALLLGRGRVARVAVVTWSATLAAAMLVDLSPRPIPGADEATCLGESPTVCTDRAYEPVLADYRSDVIWTLDQLPAYARDPITEVTSRPDASSGALIVGPAYRNNEPALLVDRELLAGRLGDAALARTCQAKDMGALLVWWRLHLDQPIDQKRYPGDMDWTQHAERDSEVARGRALHALPQADRTAWFTTNAAHLTSCRMERITWPS